MKYDQRGRLVDETQNYIGVDSQVGLFTLNYTYNDSGTLTSMTDPKGKALAFEHDIFGRLKKQNNAAVSYSGQSIMDDYIYDTQGRVTQLTYGHGVTEDFGYDELGRLKTIMGNESPLNGLDYTYTANGNLDTAIEQDGTSLQFAYDNLNRLIYVDGQLGNPLGYEIFYKHDKSGNMTSVSGTDPTGSIKKVPGRSYAPNSHRLLSTKLDGMPNVFYDEHGHITSYETGTQATGGIITKDMIYDGLGRLQSLTTNTKGQVKISYGPQGNKIVKERPDGSKEIFVYAQGSLLSNFDTQTQEWKTHLSANGRKVATVKLTNTGNIKETNFIHADRLNSSAAVTKKQGNTVQTISTHRYLPFGEELKDQGSPSLIDQFGFTGQQIQHEMEDIYDFNARYYDPVLRRFLSADDVLGKKDNAQTQNRYTYVLNNPKRFIDPTGNVPKESSGGTASTSNVPGMQGGWPQKTSPLGFSKGTFMGRMKGKISRGAKSAWNETTSQWFGVKPILNGVNIMFYGTVSILADATLQASRPPWKLIGASDQEADDANMAISTGITKGKLSGPGVLKNLRYVGLGRFGLNTKRLFYRTFYRSDSSPNAMEIGMLSEAGRKSGVGLSRKIIRDTPREDRIWLMEDHVNNTNYIAREGSPYISITTSLDVAKDFQGYTYQIRLPRIWGLFKRYQSSNIVPHTNSSEMELLVLHNIPAKYIRRNFGFTKGWMPPE